MKIYGQGYKNAEIAFVGDCASIIDMKTGLPFSGREGQQLKGKLELLGQAHSKFYWTYLIKDKTSYNDVVKFKKRGRHSEATTGELFDFYEEELIQELESLPNLKVIIAVGEIAMFVLTRQQEILKRRGSVYYWNERNDVKVVPIIHPRKWMISFIGGKRHFGNYIYSQYTYYDLKKVIDAMKQDKDLSPVQYDLILKPSYTQVIEYLQKCNTQPVVAFDIETDMKLHIITCISFACIDGSAISIPFKDNNQNYFMLHHEKSIWDEICRVLENEHVSKVGQNIIFDASYIWRLYGIETKNMEDTMVGFKILFPDFSASLATICSICTLQPYYKDTGKEHIKYSTTDLSFWEYNALDSAVTLESWFVIKKTLQLKELYVTYKRQRNLIPPLMYMGECGFKVDTTNLDDYKKKLHEEQKEAQKELDQMYVETYLKRFGNAPKDKSLNANSSKQLTNYFYIIKGLHAYKGKSGNPTCDANALKRLVRKGHREAELVQKIRGAVKMLSTYAECPLDKDNRFRNIYKPVGTKSGRLASGKSLFGTGTNAQNLPKEFKKYLIANDDEIFYDIDLDKAENRVVAYIAPDLNMIKAFEDGIDLHSQTGALISGLSIEEVILQHDNGVKCTIGDGSKTWRDWGKRANHGLNYGLGYKTFALMYEISENDAKYIINKYYQAYSGVLKYHKWVQQAIRYNRTLINCFNRSRSFLGFVDKELFKEAYSFIPQSTVADLININGLLFIWNNRNSFEGLRLRQQVHDSIVFSISKHVPVEKHIDYINLIKASLETTLRWKNLSFKIPIECKFGTALEPMKKLDLKKSDIELRELLSTAL